MKSKNVIVVVCLLATTFIGISHVAAAEKTNTDPKHQLPDPESTPPATAKPLKVFILMGQSNMLGFGRVGPEDRQGTPSYLTKKEGKYPHLIDEEAKWTVRNDVRYVQTTVGKEPVFECRPTINRLGADTFSHTTTYAALVGCGPVVNFT